jgi:DNA mismatch repair protein MutL
MRYQPVQKPSITINTNFNPFHKTETINQSGWQKIYESALSPSVEQLESPLIIPDPSHETDDLFQSGPYIVTKIKEGLLIIDAIAAHERILYNRYLDQLKGAIPSTQQSLFPHTISFSPADFQLISELEPDLKSLGFDIQPFGLNTYAIHGIPSDVQQGKEEEILESILEQFKNSFDTYTTGAKENLARSFARSLSLRKDNRLTIPEMKAIIRDLRTSEKNDKAIDGRPCMILLKTGDIADRFR